MIRAEQSKLHQLSALSTSAYLPSLISPVFAELSKVELMLSEFQMDGTRNAVLV